MIIDPEKCTGCTNCVTACPYDAIYMNDSLQIAQKCTGCAHLLDADWKEPRCVDACPTAALKFLEESEAADLIEGAEVLRPEAGLKPRVYYRNIPKKFIAGTVYDPVKKEVVIGAACTLTGNGATTDCHDRRVRGLLVRGPGCRHLLAGDRGGGLPRQELQRAQHRARRQSGRHRVGLNRDRRHEPGETVRNYMT